MTTTCQVGSGLLVEVQEQDKPEEEEKEDQEHQSLAEEGADPVEIALERYPVNVEGGLDAELVARIIKQVCFHARIGNR